MMNQKIELEDFKMNFKKTVFGQEYNARHD